MVIFSSLKYSINHFFNPERYTHHMIRSSTGFFPDLISLSIILILIWLSCEACLADTIKENSPDNNPFIQTHYSPGEITALTDEAIIAANNSLNEIAAISLENRTFSNTLLAFDQVISSLSDKTKPLIHMGYVYPDTAVSAEGMETEGKISSYIYSVYTRRDLYNAIAHQTPENLQEARLFEFVLREFRKNGLALPDDEIAQIKLLKDRLTTIESEFTANLNNDNTTLEFTKDELAGVPEDTLASYPQSEKGNYIVSLQTPDSVPVMTYATSGETRKQMYLAESYQQTEKNLPLLQEAVRLRQEIAQRLGYDSWAAYNIDGRMAGSPKNVTTFLASLKDPLHKKIIKEKAELLALKQKEDPLATELDPWDLKYFENILKKEKYAVDMQKVQEYLPLDTVRDGMFSLYGTMLGIRFEQVKDADVWSPDVTLFRVINVSDDRLLGHLYLDLFPREGKYGSMMEGAFVSGRMAENGSYIRPVVLIIGDVPAPSASRPSLLTLSDVEGLFHEFGHSMHDILTTAPYGLLSGSSVELDYSETPSQAFEEWAWTPEVIDMISGHYLNQSEKLPAEIRDSLIASRDSDIGLLYGRQWTFAEADMEFHIIPGPHNLTKEYQTLERNMLDVNASTELGDTIGTLGHLAGGYDAGYYSYLWSKIYALNLFSRFRDDGVVNASTGADYRRWILEPGNMQDGMTLLHGFLGRQPGPEEFFLRLSGQE